MYSRPVPPQKRPAPLRSRVKKFDTPIAGWISNRSLSSPMSQGQSQGAAVLDNFFPNATSAILRRGKEIYATLGMGTDDVTSIFSYVNGLNRKLFASTDTTIWDITNVIEPRNIILSVENGNRFVDDLGNFIGTLSTAGLDVFGGALGGNWIVVQFATEGGVFLVGVNGQSDGFIYDGNAFYPYVAGGVWALSYDNEVTPFQVGELVTGSTSGATGTVLDVLLGGGLVLSGDAELFENDEIITGSMGGDAQASSDATIIVPGISFPSGITSADMSYVWSYKNRLWFAQKDSLDIWFLDDVSAIGGNAEVYPLGGVFNIGGSVLWGSAWSNGSGAEGGLSEQMVVCSTEGQVVSFQGLAPIANTAWNQVGVYRVGRPLGRRAHFRGAGDIAIATTSGLVPLSKAIELDVTALSPSAVSYNIQDAWQAAVDGRGIDGWQCELWPERKMAIISPPVTIGEYDPILFISNTETGAWCRYTNWHAMSMEVFSGQLYFGGRDGIIYKANVSGSDDGETYTGVFMPLFDDLGEPSNVKVPKMGVGVSRGNKKVEYSLDFKSEFDIITPPSPTANASASGSVWGEGVWGESVWGGASSLVVTNDWKSLGGLGYSVSLCYQVTSGSVQPLDSEIIMLEMTYTTGGVLS